MTGDRDAQLGQAERLIKRGELREAADLLQDLRQRFPSDARIGARLAAVLELAEPGLARSAARPAPAPPPAPKQPTPQEIAEARIAQGDVATGIAIYERIVAKLPGDAQARARLEALRSSTAPAQEEPLPEDPVEALQVLLGRVQAKRRK